VIYIKASSGYNSVFLRIPCSEDEVVYDLAHGKISTKPTRTSIQVSKKEHVEDDVGRYINHSCNPTCKISGLFVIATRDLKRDEEITFDYNKSEDVIASPFECNCCGKMILGRKYEKNSS